jgi:hypothetical protein
MSNVKVQINVKQQSSNFKNWVLTFGIWISFDIWILTFEIRGLVYEIIYKEIPILHPLSENHQRDERSFLAGTD